MREETIGEILRKGRVAKNLTLEEVEEKKNRDIILIMDNYNGVLEYYCDSGEFRYYLEK